MSASTGYTVAPPVYEDTRPSKARYGATSAEEPLLPQQQADATWDEEGAGFDDYKVCFLAPLPSQRLLTDT